MSLRTLHENYLKLEVWRKGTVIPGQDPNYWRLDYLGNQIFYIDHGNRKSQYGWEMDHTVPKALAGSDHISNLRPLHWRENIHSGMFVKSMKQSGLSIFL